MILAARAKVNLSLRIGPRRGDGMHVLRSVMQTITWSDHIEVRDADMDELVVHGDAPDDESNLAWRGFAAGRGAGGDGPARLTLRKAIPTAAGLGGGSADAAAGLVAGGRRRGRDPAELPDLAAGLGADVPFCLHGGTALVTGVGEEVAPRAALDGFAMLVVVPPVRLATAAVYEAWDMLDGPAGDEIPPALLPPMLRDDPIVNDLWPAARYRAPELEEWHAALQARWGRPVLMSGSGPALFGLFVDLEEAAAAADGIAGPRALHPAVPAERGWVLVRR